MEMSRRAARAHWGLSEGRRDLPLAIGRVALHADSRLARGLSVKCARREWTAAHLDSRRRSSDVSRTQTPLSPDLQQIALSARRFHDSVWQSESRARRN